MEILNKEEFIEFHSEQEAHEWAMKYYEKWIRDIQPDLANIEKLDENNIGYLLYSYAGNMNILYNEFLRGINKEVYKDNLDEYSKNIDIITKEISRFELQDNIIVYRYTHKNLFKYLSKSLKIKIGNTVIDKGFMSTTLLPNLLRKFAKDHHYNCLLKIYLPKGTKGVYIRFDKSVLNEHEFLLPPNATFKIVKKYFSIKYLKIVYECELIGQ